MRPNLSDEIVEDIDVVVENISSIDADSVGFEQKLRILLGNMGDVDVKNEKGNVTKAGKIVREYR